MVNKALLSRGCVLENGSGSGNSGQNVYSKGRGGGEEYSTVQVQLEGQLVGRFSWWPPPMTSCQNYPLLLSLLEVILPLVCLFCASIHHLKLLLPISPVTSMFTNSWKCYLYKWVLRAQPAKNYWFALWICSLMLIKYAISIILIDNLLPWE